MYLNKQAKNFYKNTFCTNKNDSRLIEMKNDQLKLESELELQGGQLILTSRQSAANSCIHQGAE